MGLTSFMSTVASAAAEISKKPMSSFSFLETAVKDENFIIAKDGSLATVIRVDGTRMILGPEEMESLVHSMTLKMSAHFGRPGHAMQVWFARDPDYSPTLIKQLMVTPRTIGRRLNLNLDDLFSERERYLPKWITWEGFYMVLWTRLSILTKKEMQRAKIEKRAPSGWPVMADAQNVHLTVRAVMDRHRSYTRAVLSDLRDVGLRAEALENHDALKAIRWSVYPDQTGADWNAYCVGDKIPSRRPEVGPRDASHVFWPRLDDQIFDRESERINPRVVRVGNRLFAGVDMQIGPQEIMPFSDFLRRMIDNDEFPWRVSFLLESEGMSFLAIKSFIAAVFTLTNSENRQIRDAIKMLNELKTQGEVMIRFRTSFATWAPAGEVRLIEERASRLQRAIESWGYCSATPLAGDPLAGAFSSALGLDAASTAPAGIPPLKDAIYMLPWNRDASPWKTGAVLFRTPDGRPWPYQPGSSQQDTFIDLVFAPPGKGKSVWMNTTNLAVCLSPVATSGTGGVQLPRVAIIDIGPSSSGLISLIKESLPPDRRHEVAYYRMRMTRDYAVNPFDTQLGCRRPFPLERAFLVNFLSVLGTPVGETSPPEGLSDVAGAAVDTLYEIFDDQYTKGQPKQYVEGEDPFVDRAIAKYNVKIGQQEAWWAVVDKLFAKGAVHEAMLAQRYAVPKLEDILTAIREAPIEDVLGTAKVQTGERVVNVFSRMISTAVREYAVLTMPTKFDIGGARIVSLDLDEVAPRGGGPADKQTALMYMLARFVLAKDFYLNEEVLKAVPKQYVEHHRKLIRRIRETPKRLVYDEFHRTATSQMVREQVLVDMREGRKWGVHIVLASQLLDDFSKDMVDMASGTWIMGVGNDRAADDAAKIFGLSNTAREIVKRDLRGPGPRGAPFLTVLQLKDGKHEHLLYNTLSPMEAWAFSTTAEDVQLRNRLYDRIGAIEARRRLGRRYEGGSAKAEIERRVQIAIEQGQSDEAAQQGVVQQIVEEICLMAME
jgi:intracellular multiplication protein IcmB